jgi:hypothetical protein
VLSSQLAVQTNPGKNWTLPEKNNAKKSGGMAQVVEHLSNKCEANPGSEKYIQ